MLLYFTLGAIGVLAIIGVFIFNQLVAKRQMVENGWSDIDVQLKRRADLIPSLVETVKGYAAHEQSTLDEIIQARNDALTAGNETSAREACENTVSQGLSRLFALAEAYPDLKANKNFLSLQDELSKTEDEISFARRFYNGAVREYNTAIETFPAVLIAGPLSFTPHDFFEIAPVDRALPSVSLGG